MNSQKEHTQDLIKKRLESFRGRLEDWEISDIERLIEHVQIYADLDLKKRIRNEPNR
jgi:hypothetical protein